MPLNYDKDLEKFNAYLEKQMKGNKMIYPEFESMKSFITPSMLGINFQCNYSLEVHFEHKGLTMGSKI